MEVNALQVIEGGSGCLGLFNQRITRRTADGRYAAIIAKLMEVMTATELQVIQDRAIKQAQIIPQNWHLRYYSGDVYHLLVIATDESTKELGYSENLLPRF